jgi:hypothetical protein
MKNMKPIKQRKKSAFKVIAACSLAIALILPCLVSAKERKFGRNLLVKMKDGRIIEGELLAVKDDLLIMMNASSLTGTEVQIGEVLYLKVNKKSKLLQGIGLGFLSGAATGGIIGLLSGDDEGGWFAMTAGQKALFGALGFGILGMPIGGIAGAITGIDESIDLTSMPPGQTNLLLNKLKSYSRVAGELPQNLKILPSTPTKEEYKAVEKETPAAPSKELANYLSLHAKPEKTNRFHFSFTPGYFNSSGLGKLQGLLKNIGFGGTESYSGLFGPVTIEYPHRVKGPYFYIKDVKIEYSLRKKLALGIAYSPLGKFGASGRHVISYKDYWGYDAETYTYINGSYSGQIYFLTASYFPLPDAFLRKLTFKITTGIGYGRVKMDFYGSEFEYYYENQSPYFPMDQKSFSKNVPAALLSTELIYFFNKRWTLGINADYKYVPVKTERFPIDCYYYYWDNSYERHDEALRVNIPNQTWNLGGLGLGINFGLHF